MISRLEGFIQEKDAASMTVMTGGVGFEVFIPLSTYYQLPEDGERVVLHIKTVVRDDAIELFGFLSREEKEAFLLLTSVSRIGPRLAVSVLSGISPAELVEALNTKNAARLSSVPGVGVKTAERLILELKDKTARLAELVPRGRPPAGGCPGNRQERRADDHHLAAAGGGFQYFALVELYSHGPVRPALCRDHGQRPGLRPAGAAGPAQPAPVARPGNG